MTRAIIVWVLAGLVCADASAQPGQAGAQAKKEKHVVFVAPFENVTGDRQYDPAAQGMADLLGMMLGQQEHVTVVERHKLDLVLKEHKLSLRGLTGPKHFVQVGRLLKADIVVVGRLYMVNKQLTATAGAIEVKTARVRAKQSVPCRPADLLENSLQLATQLAAQMKFPLPRIDLKDIDQSPAASLHFGQGISLYYVGNMNGAIMQFMRTADLDPACHEAYYWSGLCYSRLKEYQNAALDLSQYLEEAPQGRHAAEARSLLAECRKHPVKPLLPGILPAGKGGKP